MSRTRAENQDVQDVAQTPDPTSPTPTTDDSTVLEADPIGDVVQDWVLRHIAGGPIARDTICWNALQTSLPELRKSIISSQLQEG